VSVLSRRSLSGVSNISVDESIPVDPRENNYDSSESESERNECEEACVLTHRHVRSPLSCRVKLLDIANCTEWRVAEFWIHSVSKQI